MFVAVLGLVVGTALALDIEVEVVIPGVTAAGTADSVNTGTAIAKVKADLDAGTFTAKLKGSAPNASSKKAKLEAPFSQTLMGLTATGTGEAKYKKPKNGSSDVTGKASGTLAFVEE